MNMTPRNVTDAGADDDETRQRVHLVWLVRLRWWAAFGQLISAAVFWFMPLDLPLQALCGIIAATSLSNAVLHWRALRPAPVSEFWILAVVTFDVLLLTSMLYASGGAGNPFSFLYLIHMALAGVILRPLWVAAEAALSTACFVWLSYVHVPLPLPPKMHQWALMWAYAVAAVSIVYFVRRVHNALRTKQALLAEAASRSERLTSLATLAAGAAHELSTPLATIAVVARELERRIAERRATDALGEDADADAGTEIEDAQLIRQEVERCRAALSHMASDAGTTSGEPLVHLGVSALVDATLDGLLPRDRVLVVADDGVLDTQVRVPTRSITQALRGILKNAFEASPNDATVRLRLRCDTGALHLTVEDRGHGMSTEILARAGEPFFTTKDPGRGPGGGMGLGLFLARTLFEHIDGSFYVTSIANRGTRVHMTLPLDVAG